MHFDDQAALEETHRHRNDRDRRDTRESRGQRADPDLFPEEATLVRSARTWVKGVHHEDHRPATGQMRYGPTCVCGCLDPTQPPCPPGPQQSNHLGMLRKEPVERQGPRRVIQSQDLRTGRVHWVVTDRYALANRPLESGSTTDSKNLAGDSCEPAPIQGRPAREALSLECPQNACGGKRSDRQIDDEKDKGERNAEIQRDPHGSARQAIRHSNPRRRRVRQKGYLRGHRILQAVTCAAKPEG